MARPTQGATLYAGMMMLANGWLPPCIALGLPLQGPVESRGPREKSTQGTPRLAA